MIKRVIIRNNTNTELGVMVEPWTQEESAAPGGAIVIEAHFSDQDLIIDVGDETFLSVWAPPEYRITSTENGGGVK
jgi:hypothetical protein